MTTDPVPPDGARLSELTEEDEADSTPAAEPRAPIGEELTAASALSGWIDIVAATGELLVASDYDGTLAPIVADPARTTADQRALQALAALAGLPHTHVAVVSGRSRAELAELTGEPHGMHLIGSHGSEFEADWQDALPEHVVELREQIVAALEPVAARHPGSFVEHKPISAAFHYRNVDPDAMDDAVDEALAAAESVPGAVVKAGKRVLELCALPADKGSALARLAQLVAADAVVFVGDDLTDEDVFVTLGPDDLGVKVGEGHTAAHVRVVDTTAVADLLETLLAARLPHVL